MGREMQTPSTGKAEGERGGGEETGKEYCRPLALASVAGGEAQPRCWLARSIPACEHRYSSATLEPQGPREEEPVAGSVQLWDPSWRKKGTETWEAGPRAWIGEPHGWF